MQRLGDEKKAQASIRGSENSSAWTRYMFVGMQRKTRAGMHMWLWIWGKTRAGIARDTTGKISSEQPGLAKHLKDFVCHLKGKKEDRKEDMNMLTFQKAHCLREI